MRHRSRLALHTLGATSLIALAASSCHDDHLYAPRTHPGDDAPSIFDAAADAAATPDPPDAAPDVEPDPGAAPAAPCLDISPEAIHFNELPVGEQARRTAHIFNCGDSEITIFRVEPKLNTMILGYDTPTHVDFAVHAPGSPMLDDGTLAPSVTLAPDEALVLEIVFSPEDARHRIGAVLIHPGATHAPGELSFSGEGKLPNRCPTARIVGELRGGASSDTGLNAAEGQGIVLDGAGSRDVEGEVVSWVWTLRSQPEASTAALRPVDNEPPTPGRRELRIDQAGAYAIELAVVDEEGLSSCAPASFWIEASAHP